MKTEADFYHLVASILKLSQSLGFEFSTAVGNMGTSLIGVRIQCQHKQLDLPLGVGILYNQNEKSIKINPEYALGMPYKVTEIIPIIMHEDKVALYREMGFEVIDPEPWTWEYTDRQSAYLVLLRCDCKLFGDKYKEVPIKEYLRKHTINHSIKKQRVEEQIATSIKRLEKSKKIISSTNSEIARNLNALTGSTNPEFTRNLDALKYLLSKKEI